MEKKDTTLQTLCTLSIALTAFCLNMVPDTSLDSCCLKKSISKQSTGQFSVKQHGLSCRRSFLLAAMKRSTFLTCNPVFHLMLLLHQSPLPHLLPPSASPRRPRKGLSDFHLTNCLIGQRADWGE